MMTEPNDQPPGDEPPSSLPPKLVVSVKGFADADVARAMGYGMGDLVRELGRYIDVSTLDGITVAVDYDAALRELDRGIEGLRPLEKTSDEGLVGVAKAPLVRRGDEVKTHMVFDAAYVCCLALEDQDPEDVRLAIALVAHECAHVEEHAVRDRQFPGILLNKRVEGYVQAYLQQFSESFWCEYAACRPAAPFGRDQTESYRESLSSRLGPARDAARQASRPTGRTATSSACSKRSATPSWRRCASRRTCSATSTGWRTAICLTSPWNCRRTTRRSSPA
jgi:hypothetical protein